MSQGPICAAQLYVFQQVLPQQGKKFEESLDEVLADVAAAGIPYIETGFTFAQSEASAARLKELLDKHSIKLCGLHGAAGGGVFHVAEQAEKAVADTLRQAEIAKKIGCPALYVNPMPKPGHAPKTDDELNVQAEHLNRLGKGLAKLGMPLGLHNHTPEALNNAREIRHYCDHTDPKLVNLCLDTHWVLRGGADPFELLEIYAKRVIALHIRNSRNGVWMEDFGDGDIDHRRMAEWVKKAEYRGPLIIELAYEKATQITRPLRENLSRSRAYVREVFGV